MVYYFLVCLPIVQQYNFKANMDSEPSSQNPTDMTAFVQNLLGQMQTRFESMSQNIVSKIDEMGTKIDELEQSVNDLKAEMGTTDVPVKKPDEAKPAESA
ncbi:heat shock factor-binding protein-like isoform X1 [Hordeum vulgare subsp. vulgare]|uniref:heat shock factor-binding protein-like isoform X1 n=1 Tax=Hordeum vulgare subsp. vulgare TaxID=112509 RepID=UPI001D1A4AF7|nr:heat shock factor-binding protein-like isoform X1 [Hordeum vulgare subsp. vulgare]